MHFAGGLFWGSVLSIDYWYPALEQAFRYIYQWSTASLLSIYPELNFIKKLQPHYISKIGYAVLIYNYAVYIYTSNAPEMWSNSYQISAKLRGVYCQLEMCSISFQISVKLLYFVYVY